ncbi:MAG: pseudouridine synthase [Candidatus Paceibacterota bacterium]
MDVRLNKYLADRKLASRREADVLIAEGKVLVNGKKAVIGQKVGDDDLVRLSPSATRAKNYLAYYKGAGTITHSPDKEKGEVDIVTKIKKDYGLENIFPIGRLDKASEGLIILSDDGLVTGALLEPGNENEKEYEVTVDKPVTAGFLKKLARGVRIEGYLTKPALTAKKSEKTFRIVLTEGKKHQIRRMCAALGWQVQNLKRVRIVNIELGRLKPNQYRKIAGKELQIFLKEMGLG